MASVSRYDPFGEIVDDFLKGFFVKPLAYEQSDPVRRMRIDVSEHNGEYTVLAELPGAKKEDINVQIDGDQVSITAEVRTEREAREGERVLHSERYAGKVARAFRLGEELDESKAVAKYNDGILELTLPKKATTASRQISIQ
jgi:HSP20 family protein